MITNFFLEIFVYLIDQFLLLLPSCDPLPSGISAAIASILGYYDYLNSFLPIDTLMLAGSVFIIIQGSLWVVFMLNWVLNKLRGSG